MSTIVPETSGLPTFAAGAAATRPASNPIRKPDDLTPYRGPKVLLVGCGGCGINIARIISKSSTAHTFFVDTGPGNTYPGENLFVIGKGEGSGGVQMKNAEAAIKKIPTMHIEPDQVPDIAIICHSLSGGSGGFIGPYVTKTFLARGIQCIVIGVLDSGSVVQAENTTGALANLKMVAENSGRTVDVMAFDNKAHSLEATNEAIRIKGAALVRLLTEPTMEIDRNDRRHFLDGAATHDAEPGLRLINVFEGSMDDDAIQPLFPDLDTDVVESVLHIRGHDGDRMVSFPAIPELTHFRKDGYFINGATPMLGVTTCNIAPLNDPLAKIEALNERIATQSKLGGAKLNLPAGTKKKRDTSGFFK